MSSFHFGKPHSLPVTFVLENKTWFSREGKPVKREWFGFLTSDTLSCS